MINESIENSNSVLTNAINNDTINTETTEAQVDSYAVNAVSDTSDTTAGSTMATAIELPIDDWRSGSIECECGEAWFKFTANEPAAHYNGGNGEYTITTNGGEDTVGYLYNSSGSLLDEDDDGGIGMQFSITASLKYGSTYYVRVKEYNCRACDFNIKVTYTPIEYTGEDTARAFPLNLGVSTDGTLCCPEGAVWYKFVANDSSVHTSGYAKYNVTVDSAIDATVTLYDTNNQLISFYDSEKNSSTLVKSAKLYYNIPYYIVIEPANQECGEYTIRVDGITKWVSVKSVSIDQTSCTIPEGHTERLTATVSPSNATNKNVVWSTSDYTCADVSVATGVVMAKKAGNVTITAKSSDNSKSDSIGVAVSAADSYHNCGGNTMATATTLPFNTWVNGTIECKNGEDWYKFTANRSDMYNDGASGICTITAQGDFDSIGYLYNADGEEISRNDDGGENNNFRITTSIEYGATYYVKVKSYWPGSGDYSLKLTYTPGETVSVVTVKSVTISPTEATMEVGETLMLDKSISPSNATHQGLIWSSSDAEVAMVNSKGVVHAKKSGVVIVMAQSVTDEALKTCSVIMVRPKLTYPDTLIKDGDTTSKLLNIKTLINENTKAYLTGKISYDVKEHIQEQLEMECDVIRADYIVVGNNPTSEYAYAILGGDPSSNIPFSFSNKLGLNSKGLAVTVVQRALEVMGYYESKDSGGYGTFDSNTYDAACSYKFLMSYDDESKEYVFDEWSFNTIFQSSTFSQRTYAAFVELNKFRVIHNTVAMWAANKVGGTYKMSENKIKNGNITGNYYGYADVLKDTMLETGTYIWEVKPDKEVYYKAGGIGDVQLQRYHYAGNTYEQTFSKPLVYGYNIGKFSIPYPLGGYINARSFYDPLFPDDARNALILYKNDEDPEYDIETVPVMVPQPEKEESYDYASAYEFVTTTWGEVEVIGTVMIFGLVFLIVLVEAAKMFLPLAFLAA